MAYPTVNAPYGFVPVNRLDGMPYAGATRQFPLTQAGAMYFGELIELDVGGVVGTATSLTGGAKLGVFVGCQYVNTQGQTVQSNFYPGSGSATSASCSTAPNPATLTCAVSTAAPTVTTRSAVLKTARRSALLQLTQLFTMARWTLAFFLASATPGEWDTGSMPGSP